MKIVPEESQSHKLGLDCHNERICQGNERNVKRHKYNMNKQ